LCTYKFYPKKGKGRFFSESAFFHKSWDEHSPLWALTAVPYMLVPDMVKQLLAIRSNYQFLSLKSKQI
jgi:hypothetical protein